MGLMGVDVDHRNPDDRLARVSYGRSRCLSLLIKKGAMVAQAQLNQIIALEKGVKSRSYADFTAAHQQLQKAALLAGISRTYKPKDDEGEQLPPESTRVQLRATEVLDQVKASLTRLFDVTLTKDTGNGAAKASIVVDGVTIAADVPVTYLLFLEKQLSDLMTFVTKLPVLDAAETWSYDEATDAYATTPSQTTRSKKVPRNHVKAEATEKHPAQVEMYFEDVLVGYWTTVKYSGALPQARVNELKARVVKLSEAVKVAREQANSSTVRDVEIGDRIFGYLFG
jgi:hypothetical protein